MTPEDYRRIALELPEATEGAHMNHPDFRVRGKIFATLWPKERRGVVMLTPEQQKSVTEAEPAVFEPVPGGWGRKGATSVNLQHAGKAAVRGALLMAWHNKAPESLSDG
ncbi:MAG: MmcQ/YjbR family DNA-binding protein [Isosphaerales bacterium]